MDNNKEPNRQEGVSARVKGEQSMAATAEQKPEANNIFQQAVATTLRENGELGMQVAVYLDGEQVV